MPDDNTYGLSRRKALLGLSTIGVAGVGAGIGTSALFSDEESFNNNTITAGTQNLTVEAGIVDDSTFDGNAGFIELGDSTPVDGDPAVGITVGDIKPGDSFVIGVDPVVEGNPGYLAVTGSVTEDSDNINTEPEVDADGDITDPSDNQATDGELLENLEITSLGYESGDANDGIPSSSVSITDDDGFPGDFPNSTGSSVPLSDLLSGLLYRGRGNGTPAGHGGSGDSVTRVGGSTSQSNVDTDRVTHLIEFTLPTSVGNVVQGDRLEFDLTWTLEQARNNDPPANASEVDGSVN